MSKGEIIDFLKWYNDLNFKNKILIAGNHDFFFEEGKPEDIAAMLAEYPNITYLNDSGVEIDGVKFWGSPVQPWFYNWAFNLPRQGEELKEKWNTIPTDIDILITHGPAWGHLDTVKFNPGVNLGCELLAERIQTVKPKIHVCGHIHSGYGYKFADGTHYFNASILDEEYNFTQKPLTIDWDPETNQIEFL